VDPLGPCPLRGSEERGELHRRKIHPSTKVSNALIPKCIACSVAKLKRTTPDSTPTIKNKDREGIILQNTLSPGKKLSCDHYMSSTLGRLSHIKGKEDKASQFVGGTLFVDFATNYIFNNHQVNLTAAATVQSKHACERHFHKHGHKVHKDTWLITIHFNQSYGLMITSCNNSSLLLFQV
jgi:hypothetical protein